MRMDRIVTATEANQHFAEVLRDVAAGESVTVTSHGKPVARIIPPEPKKARNLQKLFDYMDAHPPTVIGSWKREDLYDR
jgi:prevent-host-death family protein